MPLKYTPTTLCKECNKNKAIAKGMCGTCYRRINYKKTRDGTSHKYLVSRGLPLFKQKQDSYHVTDQGVSINAIARVSAFYNDTITLTCGLFLGYPHHCFFICETVHV